jgi:DNA polymerase-1
MEKALILDSNSILHRAFHALPSLTTKKGENTGAIYGFLLVLFKAIREIKPDYLFACFDFPAKTFRHRIFEGYKIQRPPTPKDLIPQILKLKEILKAFNISVFEKEGFEADDLIGTICEKLKEKEKIILSGDYDNLQLVNEKTKVWVLKKKVKETFLFDIVKVREKFKILPNQIPDFKALVGDPSDNIPGIPGIGDKIATMLILEFGSLERLYQELEKNSEKVQKLNPKIKKSLIENEEKILLNKELVKIKKDVPIDFDLEKLRWEKYSKEKVISLFRELEFQSLIKRLPEIEGKIEKGSGENEVKGNLKLW